MVRAAHFALGCSVALLACGPQSIHPSGTSHLSAANGASPFSGKVGLYTDSSFSTFSSEQAQLQSAGGGSLAMYLNYADFANFAPGKSLGEGIVDVSSLNQANIQLVLAFEPTNASWCTHASKTTGSATGGCRLSELTASSPNMVAIADSYARIAALADALNQPVILRFASEMNANWDDWDYGYDSSGNSAQAFIAAFELLHHYVTKNLHAGHVLFAFAPNNVSYDGSDFYSDIQAFWPGSAIVDVIGLDGYSVSNSFAADFDGQLSALEQLGSSQPLMLAEFAASTHVAGGRVAWLDGMLATIQNHPRLGYMSWFDSDKSHPYQLQDTDGTGQSLYAEFAADLLGAGSSGSGASAPTATAPVNPSCIADGQASQAGDGSDCCSGNFNPSSGNCGAPAPACIADGQASQAGDGSDCCSGNFNPSSGDCGTPAAPACIADGQPSQTGDGTDCCSGSEDENGNCFTCLATGQPSQLGDGSDCCSQSLDGSGNCQ